MKIEAKASYNLDLLCFINTMTGDDYYIEMNRDVYERFYPLVSGKTKENMQDFIKRMGHTMLSPTLTLLVSSLPDFGDRNLGEMLTCHDEIETQMNNTPCIFSREQFDLFFHAFDNAVIPLINELESAGFKTFWQEAKLPLIEDKCKEINEYMKQYDAETLINRFKSFVNSDFTVFLCSFAKPYGIKLCDNNIITDCSYDNKIILSNLTHEIFHPPYKHSDVRQAVDSLGKLPFVADAFNSQNPHSGYNVMEGFIEENIVEALGIYVLAQIGVDIDPFEYFKKHDGGSHVISPHFYRYLCDNKKDAAQAFEDYFTRFADALRA